MTTRGQQLAEAIIEHDLACLACGYNLRGLASAVIHCPECGVECNVARMITERWSGPWQRAPGFSTLVAPVAWITLAGLCLVPILAYELHGGGSGVIAVICAFIVLAVWMQHLHRARVVFGDGDRGAWLALLAHVLLVSYIAGSALTVVGIVRGFFAAPDWPLFALNMFTMLAGVGVFVATRRCERYIAEQCIRRYLLQRTSGSSDDVGQPQGEASAIGSQVSCGDEC